MPFCKTSLVPAQPEEVFQWHARPGALDRLLPPWEEIRIAKRSDGIEIGFQVVLVNRLGLGEMADELLLSSTRVAPRRLLETGYRFRYPDLAETLRFQLGRLQD